MAAAPPVEPPPASRVDAGPSAEPSPTRVVEAPAVAEGESVPLPTMPTSPPGRAGVEGALAAMGAGAAQSAADGAEAGPAIDSGRFPPRGEVPDDIRIAMRSEKGMEVGGETLRSERGTTKEEIRADVQAEVSRNLALAANKPDNLANVKALAEFAETVGVSREEVTAWLQKLKAEPATVFSPEAASAVTQPGQPAEVQQGAAAQAAAESGDIPSVAEMQARLQRGLTIGGVKIQTSETVDAAAAFANGIRQFVGSRPDGLSAADQEILTYMINTARVAGIPTDQIRIALDADYPKRAVVDPDGKVLSPAVEGWKQETVSALDVLGIPRDIPASPQEKILPEERQRAETARRSAMADIIKSNRAEGGAKLPAARLLPAEDIKAAAAEVIGRVASGYKPDSQEAEVLKGILQHCDPEDFASIVAYPGRFAAEEGALKVADLMRRKIKHYTEINRKFGKRWKDMDEDEQDITLAKEQFAALMANQEELKKLRREYLKAQPFIAQLLKLIFGVIASTGYQLVADEMGQISEGRIAQ